VTCGSKDASAIALQTAANASGLTALAALTRAGFFILFQVPFFGSTRAASILPSRLVDSLPDDSLKGHRDRAMIMLGFAGAFRKSEVVALNVEDLEFCDEGARVTIRRSKTDQEAKGQTIAVLRGAGPFCPVRLLREWLDAAGIIEGALFRQVPKGGKRIGGRLGGRAYYEVIKQGIAGIGLNASKYGSHSMRSGWISTAARNGASVWKMKEISRHKTTDVLASYIREAELFQQHAVGRDVLRGRDGGTALVIAYAKANPGKLSYASGGTGSSLHVRWDSQPFERYDHRAV
jgi:integrase